jgi:hypothetical protein
MEGKKWKGKNEKTKRAREDERKARVEEDSEVNGKGKDNGNSFFFSLEEKGGREKGRE